MPLLRGRDFSDRDTAATPLAAIVSERLAEHLWPNEDAVGKRISWPDWNGAPRAPLEVIGVAADSKYRSLTVAAPLLLYVSTYQFYDARPTLVLRTSSDPEPALAALGASVKAVDPDLAVYAPETMREHMDGSLWQQRMAATWIGAFSLLALALAAIGLYGVVAQSVAQRKREIGIRVALGAAPGSVSRLMIREGMRLVVLGLAVGIPAAMGIATVLRRAIEGINDAGALSYFATAAALVLVMLAACWLPARRASRVDPLEALRNE